MKSSRLYSKVLVVTGDSRSPAAEAYRTLRTNLQYAGVDKPIQKVLVAGPTIGCGKSTTLANLGITLAQTGASVLLLDTDLRKPMLHRMFKFRNDHGITNLLFDRELSPDMAIYKSLIENLYILSSGPVPPNPSELLAAEKFRHLVDELAVSFDYLLFDSPPVNAVTDAAILSQLVDATIFVIRYGQVKKDEAAHALEQLRKVEANIIGAVMNAVPTGNGRTTITNMVNNCDSLVSPVASIIWFKLFFSVLLVKVPGFSFLGQGCSKPRRFAGPSRVDKYKNWS